ncbi:acyl-CoA dehydrogenase family protein [Actinomadura madurae]|uniref:acyl-CoA dehydrogenase family protein n=1 Tax=Actinomadura madurae TaxID=1993 RepID=UPI0020D1F63E|nr:acyl-CoA dehydrogenase family protein [Actinomadura madurae]MCP9977529.1 acyl-CoA dehydrogenase family protein [Actinomadura madurae]
MGLAITEEHQELATVVREFATEQRVRAAARAALDPDAPSVPDVWKRIADLGWLGLHLPESAGGSGFGVPELAIVVDELGHAVGPGRLLPSVTASAVLAGSGGEALRELVTRLADGSAVAGLGLAPGLTREARRCSHRGADGACGAVGRRVRARGPATTCSSSPPVPARSPWPP